MNNSSDSEIYVILCFTNLALTCIIVLMLALTQEASCNNQDRINDRIDYLERSLHIEAEEK